MIWLPIDDKARNGDDVLLWGPAIGHMVAGFDGDLAASVGGQYPWFTLDGPNYHKDAFTHWMPLPHPPGERMPRSNGGDDLHR